MTEKKRNWGFARLSQDKRSEMASLGGRTAQHLGRSHKFNSETGKAAGRKGGIMRQRQLKLPWG